MRGTLCRITQTIFVYVDCTKYIYIHSYVYTYVYYIYIYMYIKQVKSIHPGNREMNIDTKNGIFGERLFEDRARTTILVPLGQLPHQCPSHGRWRELVQKSPRDQRKLEKKTPKSSTSKAIRSKKYTLPETNIAPEN